VSLDLLRDAAHHLGALEHGDDVAQRHEILDLERGQRARDTVEAALVALQRLERGVRLVQQARDRLERVLLVADVHGDDRHVLRHRDHGDVDRARHALGRAMARAGLRRRDVRVRDEVHVGACDAARVARQDDGAVHLRQFRQALRAVRGIEQEAARADVEHLGPVADDDQRAHARLQDAVETLAEGLARGDGGERVEQGDAAPRGHDRKW
jgi:hypothetical protein